jgi:hypothetical protein
MGDMRGVFTLLFVEFEDELSRRFFLQFHGRSVIGDDLKRLCPNGLQGIILKLDFLLRMRRAVLILDGLSHLRQLEVIFILWLWELAVEIARFHLGVPEANERFPGNLTFPV